MYYNISGFKDGHSLKIKKIRYSSILHSYIEYLCNNALVEYKDNLKVEKPTMKCFFLSNSTQILRNKHLL